MSHYEQSQLRSRPAILGLFRSPAIILVLSTQNLALCSSKLRIAARKQSDIDIAVLYAQKPDYESVRSVLAIAQDTLRTDDIDLCVLNDTSPILAFHAISGNRLLMFSPVRVTAFESLVARQYEDETDRIERAISI